MLSHWNSDDNGASKRVFSYYISNLKSYKHFAFINDLTRLPRPQSCINDVTRKHYYCGTCLNRFISQEYGIDTFFHVNN